MIANDMSHVCNSRQQVLLQKLTVSELLKQLPAFYTPRKFITVFTAACDLSLS